MSREILATRWYTPGFGNSAYQVGAVLVWYPQDNYAQAYIGVAEGLDEGYDVHGIATWGAKLEPHVARAIWPKETAGLTFKQEVAA